MDKDNETDEKPSRAFLKRLYDELKEASKGEGGLTLESLTAAVRKARAHAGGKARAERAKSAGEESLTDMIEKVSRALTQAFLLPITRESIFYWPKEVYLDRVIACSSVDGKYFEIPYTIAGDDVTFGEPVEVEETYTPVSMNELASLCAKGHGSRLFIENAFAEPPEWMPLLPKPGEFKHPVYGEIVITKDRNEHFVQNFKDKVYQERLPVDAEHQTKLSGAVGWITDMRVNEDGSADAKVEWTDTGVALIEADRFAYVSPEWYDAWCSPVGDEHEDVVIGAALTTRPFFKEGSLRPLIASERGLEALDEARTDFQSHTYYFTALAPSADKESKTMADKPEEQSGTPAPAQTDAQKFAEAESARQAAETRAKKAEGEVRQMGERIAVLEKQERTRRFNDLIKSGNWLGKPESHLKFMEKFGEDSDEFKEYVAEQDAIAEQANTAGLFAEVGSNATSGGDAWGKVKAAAEQMVKDGKAETFQQAVTAVAKTQPQLYREYERELKSAN